MKLSTEYLDEAKAIQEKRATEYDPNGKVERSMEAIVKAFNALFNKDLTETQGWQFMVLLKMKRQDGSPVHHEDSALDEVSYASLAAESSSREGGPKG